MGKATRPMPGLRPSLPVKAAAGSGKVPAGKIPPAKKTAAENLEKATKTGSHAPSMSDLTLELKHPSHLVVEHRTAIPYAVSSCQEVPVEMDGKQLRVSVVVAVSPWGFIDYMEGRKDLPTANAKLEALVREIASRLEIV